jgi:hypothetical protein
MSEIEELKSKISELEDRIQLIEKRFNPEEIQAFTKDLSVREFLNSVKTSNDVQKTLLIMFFLEKYEGLTRINIDDLRSGFRNAKEPVPKNISDKIYLGIKKGHIMETSEKKDKKSCFMVTNTGEKYIENELNHSLLVYY